MPCCFPPETGSKSFERCIFTKIKTCIGHCLIFLHHSPPEGNLGINIETRLCWYFAYGRSDDDLHFRFAFPWYSYSPTLKFRQLDMSSDEEKDKKGQNLPLSFTAKQGENRGWNDGKGGDAEGAGGESHCIAIHSWLRPPDSTHCLSRLFPLSNISHCQLYFVLDF